jgi:DNA-binding FadR family transcriptional regulator
VKKKPYHRKLYQYIVEALGRRIVQGHYDDIKGLPTEDRLCAEFDVSRGVLREATKVLTQKGLIETRPRVGTRVLAREQWNLFDPDVLLWRLQIEDASSFLRTVTEVRRVIESEAARLAAIRASQQEVGAIEASLGRLERMLDDDAGYDYETYLAMDIAFHTSILKAGHNELLSQIGRTMREAVHQAREHDARDIDLQKQSMPFHRAIVAGIVQADPDTAYLASQQMFDDVWQYLDNR